MGYSNSSILIRALGCFGSASGAEEWSCNFRFCIPGTNIAYDAGKLQTFVDAAHTAFGTFHGTSTTGAGNGCYYLQASGARLGDGLGKYDPDTQDTIYSTVTPQAGPTATNLPWTSCLVIGLRTGRPRGYASNGRIYWPYTTSGIVAGTGRVSSSNVYDRIGNCKTLVNALNTAAGAYQTGLKLAVMSKVGAGLSAVVTELRVDDRVDNIERRENALPPSYQYATIP